MSAAVMRPSLSSQVHDISEKLKSTDSDIRNQTLLDLHKDLVILTDPLASASTSTSHRRHAYDTNYADETTESTLVQLVLGRIVTDKSEAEVSDVKTAAISCLGAMSRKSRPAQLKKIAETLMNGLLSTNEEQRDVASLALKAVISEIPPEASQLPQLFESILTKVYAILSKTSPPPEPQLATELLQIVNDIFTRFPHVISTTATIQSSSLSALTKLLTTARPAIRKRAVPALASLVANQPKLFDVKLRETILKGLQEDGDTGHTWATVLASLAKGLTAAVVGEMVAEGQVSEALLKQTVDFEQNERVEGALMALEVIVLRCPTEVTPYLSQTTQRAIDLIKYDPNYVDLGEDDVEMDDDDDEEDEDYDDEAYSDDEDISWKLRRAAAKLLIAIIGTRTELLADLYRTAAPVLISRFGEREESVRLEVLSAFETLLNQTITVRTAELASGHRNKRKRSEGMDEDSVVDDSISDLRNCLPSLVRAILKQLASKSAPTRRECFVLLRDITEALAGGLDTDFEPISKAVISALSSADSSTTSSLPIAALSFLSAFFTFNPPKAYSERLKSLVPAMVSGIRDKLQRVSFEAFTATSSLARSLRLSGSASPLQDSLAQPIQTLFDAVQEVLADTSVDGDVRQRALQTIGDLLVHEGDILSGSYERCLPLIATRLSNETTSATAIQVIGQIAESPLCQGARIDEWLLEVLPEVVSNVRRARRTAGRSHEFACLQNILNRIGSNLPVEVANQILTDLRPSLDNPPVLMAIASILTNQPASHTIVDSHVLPQIYETIKTSPSTSSFSDALTMFFGAYVDGDIDSAIRLVPALLDNLGKQADSSEPPSTSSYQLTARCVGTVVEHSQRNQAGVVTSLRKTLKSDKATQSDTLLALLSLGEIGRKSNLSSTPDLFNLVLSSFQSNDQDIRNAAAFAVGNMTVGSEGAYLSDIVSGTQNAKTESSRLLYLHALKEVFLHSSPTRLEVISDQVWPPLFSGSKISAKANGAAAQDVLADDGERNVKAACIGKLATAAPAKFLPKLQELLSSTPQNRAIVAAAIRYTLIDTTSAHDDVLAPVIGDFLSLMSDDNLIVRRLSLASLNAAIQNKPHLVVDRLADLQPALYEETQIKPELQREIVMGPFKVIEDDGVENRKAAYETMYTMLGTCFAKVDLPTFTDRVMAALKDKNEIKVLGLMILLRLAQLSPTSVIPRLDEAAESMKVIMKDLEVKDDVLKQDLERKEEMQRTCLRTAVPLYRMSSQTQAPNFHAFVAALLIKDQWAEFRDYRS